MNQSGRFRRVAIILLIAAGYAATARVGFRFAFVAEQITTVWAPTGIAMAALLAGGLELWPAIWLGAFAANAGTDAPLWTALLIATGNTLEAVGAVRLLRLVPRVTATLDRVVDVLAFITLASGVATMVSASVGVLTLCAAGVQPWARFGALWADWWLGDAMGALIVAPALIKIIGRRWSRRGGVVAALLVGGTVLATQLVFGRRFGLGVHPLEFVVFPPVVAAAVLGGRTITALAVFAASALATWHTVHGAGPFAGPDVHRSLVLLQTFMGVLAATAMLLASAIAERRASARRAAEAVEELRQRERMLRLAQRAGGIATFEWDFAAQRANCSAEFFALFGLPRHDGVMTGEEWGRFVHPADRERMATHLARAVEGLEAAEADYRIVTAVGTVRWLSYAGQFQRTAGGARLLGTVVDITARKTAETVLRQEVEVHTALAQVGAALAGELRSEPLVQAITDAATALTGAEFGAFFYRVSDQEGDAYPLYTLSGAPKSAFAHFPPPRATAVFGPVFRGEGIVRADDITLDPRYGQNAPYHGMPHGHLPVRSYLAVPVAARGGDVLGGLVFGHSAPGVFGERHETLASGVAGWAAIALENARLYQHAEAANRLKDEFLATVSHELRTPLNAVLGWAHMLREGAMPDEMRDRAFESLERNARAQAQLVDDLLDVSRIMAGKLQINADVVDVATVLEDAVETVSAGATAKQLELHVRVPEDRRLRVTGDADRLRQVVWNLVSNAVKFTPDGGRVDVELLQTGTRADIVVRDTGEGIDAAFQPYLFQRFRQVDATRTRRHGGLGLGLSIVRHLTEAHGGTVRAESAGEGQGATFRVSLPLHSVETGSPAADPAVDGRAPDPVLAGVRALVVDDDADARALMQFALERRAAEVQTAASAGEALGLLTRQPFDVLIADIGMPGQDGLSLIRVVRRLARPADVRGIPAVAVTAYAGLQARDAALAAGFDWHMGKPVDAEQLVAAIVAVRRTPRVRTPAPSSPSSASSS